jgi:hypothetical protein
MDETLRFLVGVALFLAVVAYEWMKGRSGKEAS